MFEEKYKKDNDNILPDEAIKRYIKSKLTEKVRKPTFRFNYNAALAAALSLVLAIGVVFVAKSPALSVQYVGESTLMKEITYDSIYASLSSRFEERYDIFDYITDDFDNPKGDAVLEGSTGTGTNDLGGVREPEGNASSSTNNQVQGVDEVDLVKNDGRYIYSIKDMSIIITDSNNGDPKVICKHSVSDKGSNITGLFINGDRLAVIFNEYMYSDICTKIVVFDISNKESIKEIATKEQDGFYNDSRMIGNNVYLLSNHTVNNNISKEEPESYIPCVDGALLKESGLYMIEDFENTQYLVISSIDIVTAEIKDTSAILGGASNVYCNTENLYFTYSKQGELSKDNSTEYKTETIIVKLNLSDGKISMTATGEVTGYPLNQFSMDEYENHLRIVTTVESTVVTKRENSQAQSYLNETSNALYVLDEDLNIVGRIEDLAKNERVYSVRFQGDVGYFVTFKQVDPLFTVDLSNPKEPKVLNELKIPGFSEYLHPFGEGKLFGFGKSATVQGSVTGLKISMFDVSDQTNVTENHVTPIDAAWSEASENHKAIMVDEKKNIIAFLATDNFSNTNLYVYGYDDQNGFYKRAITFVDDKYTFGSRFVWINDYFYLVNQKGITVFNLEDFNKISYLDF